MNEIKCPHCGKAFTVDEAGYAAILSQVRTKEFDNEVHKRLEDVMESARKEGELNLNKALAEKDSEINGLKLQLQQLESDAKNSQSRTELEISK